MPPAVSSTEPAVQRCISCGERSMLAFCARCGERNVDESDFSVRRFVVQAVKVLTNVDSTVGRSFGSLVRRPGHLTAEYLVGRRKPYLKPLQVFLIANLVFFVMHSVFPAYVFTTRLRDHLLHHVYSPLILDLRTGDGPTFRTLLDDPEAFAAYAHTFQIVTTALAKTLIVLMVPIFAAISWLLYRRYARFYVQHLVFGLHFYAVMLLLISAVAIPMAALPHVTRALGVQPGWQAVDAGFGLVVLAFAWTYLARAGRRAFGASTAATVASGAVLGFGFFLVLYLYRLILFLATVAMI